MQYRPTCL